MEVYASTLILIIKGRLSVQNIDSGDEPDEFWEELGGKRPIDPAV